LEPIFAAPTNETVRRPQPHGDAELFNDRSESTPDRSVRTGRDAPMSDVVVAASAACLRTGDVVVHAVDHGVVGSEIVADLHDMVVTMLDSALAHGKPDVPVTLIGSTHELGYLIWIVDDGEGLDGERRAVLNDALGGRLDRDDRSTLLRRLAEMGERAGVTGIDIELLADEDGGNLARLFVPARHLVVDAAGPTADVPVHEIESTPEQRRADPLASVTTEKLSTRLARRGRAVAPRPSQSVAASEIDRLTSTRSRPSSRMERSGDPVTPAWPPSEARPVALGDTAAAAGLSDAERRAAVARRLVEQYRGGVSAALMDAADDVGMAGPAENRS